MSEQPDDRPPAEDEQSRTEQPPQHEQPQGQPPQGGGQPPNGQPPVGHPPAQQQNGIGEIFNRDDTKSQIQTGVVFFTAIGVGFGLALLLGDAFEDAALTNASTGPSLAPLVAAIVAFHQREPLADVADNLAYATAAVTTAAGAVVLSLLTWLFAEIILDANPDLGDIFLIWIAAAVGAAVTALIVVAAYRNL